MSCFDLEPPPPPQRPFSVLFAVWAPSTREVPRRSAPSPALRHEAIVSAARAVFALGGELVVPADPDVAPLLAAIALDFTASPTAEGDRRPRRPLTVVETGGPDPFIRSRLAPYAARGAVRYVLPLDDEVIIADDRHLPRGLRRRHAVTPELLAEHRLVGAIFISPHRDADVEMRLLQEHGVEVAVLMDTIDREDLAQSRRGPERPDAESPDSLWEQWSLRDPTLDILGDVGGDRWTEHEGQRRDRRSAVTPYAYIVQALIASWTHPPGQLAE